MTGPEGHVPTTLPRAEVLAMLSDMARGCPELLRGDEQHPVARVGIEFMRAYDITAADIRAVLPDGEVVVRRQGTEQYVSGSRLQAASARFDEAVRLAELGGDHVWITLVTHHVLDPAAPGERHLDAENIVGAYLGCYRCEQPFEPRLLRRRCQGERR